MNKKESIRECPEDKKLVITPDTTIEELLNVYPELEPILTEFAPQLQTLKDPTLKKSIHKVTKLQRVAEMGQHPIGTIINRLRQETGQGDFPGESESIPGGGPDWVNTRTVAKTLDARPLLEAGQHPVNIVMEELSQLHPNQLFELITPFLPSPLIDMAKSNGFLAWTKEEMPGVFKTYFGR